MKLSTNTLGMLAFTVIAVTAFVWMAKRPAVEGQTTQFGMPLQANTKSKGEAKEKPVLVDEKPADSNASSEGATSDKGSASAEGSIPAEDSASAEGSTPAEGTESTSPKQD